MATSIVDHAGIVQPGMESTPVQRTTDTSTVGTHDAVLGEPAAEQVRIEQFVGVLRKCLPSIVDEFNTVRLPALEVALGRPFREEFTTETTDSVTKVLCRPINNAMFRHIRAQLSDFTELATNGSDWKLGEIPIEDKNSFSDANAWTGNGFDKTGWHLLKKFAIDENGRITAMFVAVVDIRKCAGCWTDKKMTSNFSSLKFTCEDLPHLHVVHGEVNPKKKWLKIITQSVSLRS